MEKSKKIKLFIALSYLIIILLLLYLFFSNFSFKEITSYEFIKNHRNYFLNLRDTNLFILSMLFLLVTILWVFPLLGFGSPIAMLGGFILGKWLGALIVVLGLSIGATLLYIFGNYFLKDFVKEKFSNKYENLNLKFKKSEFTYLLIYRFCGGIPWQLSCLLPTIFNVKIKNFFYATLIGIVPQVFLVVSIGSGLEKVINENLNIPGPMELIGSPEIYVPLIVFFCLVIITIFLRKKFYSK
ncbi:MAG: DedA family protein [Candidatus Pelagibacter sp.]|nr:DedA family protein [Candidatus Pelagibacter sp.]